MALKDLFRKYGENDYLKLKFDPNTKRFDYYYGLELIPPKKLNSNLKKQLEEKNNELKNNPDALKKEFEKIEHDKKTIERAEKLKQMGYSLGSTSVVGNKKQAPLPKEFEKRLDNMLSEENVLYGIHRVGNISEDSLINILENGLDMTVLAYGLSDESVSLSQNVGYYPDNMEIKSELINAYGYKNSKGSLLIRIPDEDLINHNYFDKKENEYIKLKPEYIVGYVPVRHLSDGRVTIDSILTLKDLKKEEKEELDFSEYTEETNDNNISRSR